MNYVQSFNLFGVDAKQIPSITGSGAPTTKTEGAVGCFYMDTASENKDVYKCTAVANGAYTWVAFGNGSSSEGNSGSSEGNSGSSEGTGGSSEDNGGSTEGSAKANNHVVGRPSTNLFNKDTVTVGFYLNVSTGEYIENANYWVSDYIPVTPGETYTCDYLSFAAYYSADKTLLKSAGGTVPFTVPDNAYFLRCCCGVSELPTFKINKGEILLPYEPYGEGFLTADNLTEEFEDGIKRSLKTTFVSGRPSTNLFDKSAVTEGHYVAPSNGNLVEHPDYCVTDFIPVIPGETYTVSHVNHPTYFSISKRWKGGGVSTNTFTVPEGVYFFRCSVENNNVDSFQMNLGDTLLPYEKYGVFLTPDAISDEVVSELKNKFDETNSEDKSINMSCFDRLRNHLMNPFVKTQIKLLGDSITHGMGGTGFSATGGDIPGAVGKQNVLTATCWSNMLYHYINDNYNKDVEVSVLDERIKYNNPDDINKFVFDQTLVRLNGVSGYVLYYKYARHTGYVAVPNAVEFTFYGDHFSALYMEQKYSGIFEIYVDDIKMAEVDAYADTATHRKRADVTGLSLGEHTVRIAITGRKNESASAYQFNLCGLVIPKTAIVKPWGVSGSSSKYPIDLPSIYEETDDFVIMQFGTNDRHMFYTPDFTCENLITATNNIKTATGADIILMASCPAAYQFEYGDDAVRYYHMWDVRNAVAKAAEHFGMPYVDNYDAFMKYADQHDMSFTELLADGLHPNDLGYKVMYENIMRTFGLPIVPDYSQT